MKCFGVRGTVTLYFSPTETLLSPYYLITMLKDKMRLTQHATCQGSLQADSSLSVLLPWSGGRKWD